MKFSAFLFVNLPLLYSDTPLISCRLSANEHHCILKRLYQHDINDVVIRSIYRIKIPFWETCREKKTKIRSVDFFSSCFRWNNCSIFWEWQIEENSIEEARLVFRRKRLYRNNSLSRGLLMLVSFRFEHLRDVPAKWL